MNIGTIVAATVTLVAIYLFVNDRSNSSSVIRSLASGYAESVRALQGR